MAVHYRQRGTALARELAHPVVRRLVCTCVMADEVLLWDWLVEHLDPQRFRVASTELVRDGYSRRTEVLFTNELDGHRFARWAESRGFQLEELS